MNKTLALGLLALTFGPACQSQNSTASINTGVVVPIHVPEVTFTPTVWETAGSELLPSLRITTPAHDQDVTYRFEYEGDGAVQLPDPVTVEAGTTNLHIKSPFRTNQVKQTAQGIVRVIWSHPEADDHIAGQWNVVQRPSILREIRVARADNLVDNDVWDATFAITVELDPLEEWVDQSLAAHRDVFFESSAGTTESSPKIQVFANVEASDYPSFPREIVPVGPFQSYVVCVKRPKLPARKRPFLHVKARSGGDELERYLKLPF